ncbi:MAG: hypothetical protein KGJ78_01920 [Alphaproteobacteria bacterium]|nr:hypothetical protein [Alphaproteobacteria bacterium]
MAAVIVHASCVRLGRAGAAFGAPPSCGILLIGPSGAGKSDLALRLIAMGAVLVADDRTELFVARGALYARPPARGAGLLEIRGVGILELPHSPRAPITLAVTLGSRGQRLPEHRSYRPPGRLGLPPRAAPPLLTLPAFEASTPGKIGAAAAAYALGLHREDVNPI